MAKVKSTIATSLQGRIGNVSFRRAAGQRIIAAELPSLVTNPRTVSQMSQRVRLAALVNFYRASKSWMPKTWQMKEAKQSVYNAFVRANLASNPVALTKQEAAEGATVCYPWRVTDGTLNPVSIAEGSDSVFITNIFIGNDAAVLGSAATVSDLSAALLANNLSLRPGDQISFVLYRQMSATGSGMPYVTCTPYEIKVDTSDGRLVGSRLPLDIIQAAGAEGALSIGVNMSGVVGAFAVVVSRKDGGTIEVSKSDLVCSSDNLYSFYTSAEHQAAAGASYGNNDVVFIDPAGEEVRAYNDAATTRQVLGVFIGDDAASAVYYPVGSRLPEEIAPGTLVAVKVTTTENLAPLEEAVTWFVESGSNITVTATTVTSTTITTSRANPTSRILRIRVAYNNGEYVYGEFPAGTE